MAHNRGNGETSPWVWILGGCGFLVLLGVVAMLVIGFGFYRFAQDTEALMKDPQRREERVLEMLGAERVPSGYFPGFVISIPLFGDIASLTDRPPKENGEPEEPEERAFLYMDFIFMSNQEDLEAFFTGEREQLESLENVQIQGPVEVDFDDAQFIGRGQFDTNGFTAWYRVMQGGVELDKPGYHGVSALMWVRCANDDRARLAAWVVPDPAGGDFEKAETTDYSGTPGDESSLKSFMSRFHFCEAP